MVREPISKINNGKAARPPGLLSEMVAGEAGEAGADMITDLLNRLIAEGVNPAEWELSTIANCYKGKGSSLEKGNYTELKLTDQILKIADRIIEKLIRRQVDLIRCSLVSCQDVEPQTPLS